MCQNTHPALCHIKCETAQCFIYSQFQVALTDVILQYTVINSFDIIQWEQITSLLSGHCPKFYCYHKCNQPAYSNLFSCYRFLIHKKPLFISII